MLYYSTNGKASKADLQKAVVKGLAEDRGLYMPEVIHQLPKTFFEDMPKMKFQDIAFNVASAFFGDDVDLDALQDLVYDTLQFPVR
jgi:threonine synthase